MLPLPITSLYAIPLTLIYLGLFVSVVKERSRLNVAIGDGGNIGLHERIRRHGNFVEWVPMVLILMILAEAQGTGALWLHLSGAALTIGRLIHPFGLKADAPSHPLRLAGNTGGLIATAIPIVALARHSFGF